MRAPVVVALAILALVPLTGCTEPPAPAKPLAGAASYYVAAVKQTDLLAADSPVCLPEPFPAWHEVPRVEGGVVPRGTEVIEIAAVVSGLWTGFQVGYRIDDAPFVWSDRMDQGAASIVIDVRPDQVEADVPRWTFAWRTQLLGQDCMEGVYSGSLAILVAAHVRNQA